MKPPLLERHYQENSNNHSDASNESVDKQENKEVNKNDTVVNEIETETNLNEKSHDTPKIAVLSNNRDVSNQASNAPASQSLVIPNIANNPSESFNGTSPAVLCRICYASDDPKEPLIHPCNCSGTIGLIHKSCLEKWLSQSNTNKCEICNYEFAIDRTPRSFGQWLFRPVSTRNNKNILNDFLGFLILTPLAWTWYCVGFALRFYESGDPWKAIGLVVCISFLLLFYVLWVVFSCKYHYKIFKEWQKENQIVTLRLSEDKNKKSIHIHYCSVSKQVFSSVMPVESATNILNISEIEQPQTSGDMKDTSRDTFEDYVEIRIQQVNKQGRIETNENDESR